MPGAASLIVGAYDYQRKAPMPPAGLAVGRVAAYSWEDHYAVLREALDAIATTTLANVSDVVAGRENPNRVTVG